MATQFQHRLVGTVLLVALGVIFLPDLLDGKQPPTPDEAVTIPLRPELAPPRPAPLPAEPEPAEPDVTARAETWTLEEAREAPPQPPKPQPQVVSAPVQNTAPAPVPKPEPKPVLKPEPKPEPVRPAPEVKPAAPAPAPLQAGVIKPVESLPQPAAVSQPAPAAPVAGVIKPVTQAPQASSPAAVSASGQFVVQLGAFRSADNVNALVRKLQAAGYRAQTTPSVPREGELNRVWVGPDSRARLEQQLPAMERLTGLKGRVMAQ